VGGYHDDVNHHLQCAHPDLRRLVLEEALSHVEALMSNFTMAYEAMPNLIVSPPLSLPFGAMRIIHEVHLV